MNGEGGGGEASARPKKGARMHHCAQVIVNTAR